VRGKEQLKYLAVVALATAVATGIGRTEWGRSLASLYYDYWHVFSGVRYEPEHTALVSVDDRTLAALKDEPFAFWAPHFGRVLDTLAKAGVKTVGFDVLYQVSAESWLRKLDLADSERSRNYDSPLRSALAAGGVILIAHLVDRGGGTADLLAPPPDQLALLPGGMRDVGIANLFPDDDKHVRRFLPVLNPDPASPWIAFGMLLALRAAQKDPAALEWEINGTRIGRDSGPLAIGYAGPPGSVPAVSMHALLEPDALSKPAVRALKGRIVILAASNAGTPDRHFTPYSRDPRAEQMTGGEIHANIAETILTGRSPRRLPIGLELAYLVLFVAIATLLLRGLAAGASVACAVVVGALALVPAFAAFQLDWVIAVAEPQFGIAAALLMTLGLRLTGEERERARIRQVFGRYVSDEVVDKVLSEDRRPDLGGEALTVTVLFSDIRGFTSISEKLSAHEVVEMLNAYFTRACEPILAQGGTVDKYIGDAVMAVFGSPVRYPDHARRALRAAVGMARAAAEFKQWMKARFPDRDLPEFGIGVGLHTGEAVIGDIGTPKRKEFTAIGDTVNAASRLEGATKDLGCVIVASEATLSAAGAGVKAGKTEEIRVKGKAESIKVYEILGAE
jgi:adenylate cyclase